MRSTCDWTWRPNSRSTFARSARMGSKICERSIEELATAVRRTLSRPEQAVKVRRGPSRELAFVHFEQSRETGDHASHMGRLIALAAMRHRREKGTVGFGEQTFHRHEADGLAKIGRFGKRDDARDRNEEAQLEARVR